MIVFVNINLVFLPENPKWLSNKGWKKKAENAGKYFYNILQENTSLINNETFEELPNRSIAERFLATLYGSLLQSTDI